MNYLKYLLSDKTDWTRFAKYPVLKIVIFKIISTNDYTDNVIIMKEIVNDKPNDSTEYTVYRDLFAPV